MVEELQNSNTTTEVTTETKVTEEPGFALPKMDSVTQQILLEKGSNILATLIGVEVKKQDKKSFGVTFSESEIKVLERYAERMAELEIIPRNSIGSLTHFCTIEYLRIIEHKSALYLQKKQQEEKKSGAN